MKRTKTRRIIRRSGALDGALSDAQNAIALNTMDGRVPELDAQARVTFAEIERLRRLLLKNSIRDRLNRD